jgi:PTH1 family peptidyl-tRNA hydrolase
MDWLMEIPAIIPPMRVILGIGNPGRQYHGTRHNCGFLVIDELEQRHGPFSWRKAWNAQVAEWPNAPGGKALLVKPETFVNLSGESAQAVLTFHKLSLNDLLVVVDDLHLPLGHLRLRPDGSPGGHNGLKDIQARLGPIYPRLKMGIGKPPPGGDQVNWVLGHFLPEEQATAQAMVRRAADCCTHWLVEGMPVACRFNGPGAVSAPTVPGARAAETPNPAG